MGTPTDYLPSVFPEDTILSFLESISVPRPIGIEQLETSAAFHSIYILTYASDRLKVWLEARNIHLSFSHPLDLVLRVSGDHMPRIKTENEVAVLRWVKEHTNIPVPSVVFHDASYHNDLEREYILMTREPGDCLADVYKSFSKDQMTHIISQVVDVQQQLHSIPMNHIGGFALDADSIVPGPIIEEEMWFAPDIERYWPCETYGTLNVHTPAYSYVEYITLHMQRYIYAIERHASLEPMRDTVPLIKRFLAALETKADILNDVPLRVAHKDLHFGNILVDTTTAQITAVLDWEFAGSVPFTKWDPHSAFLWNGQSSSQAKAEQHRLYGQYVKEAKRQGLEYLIKDAEPTSQLQQSMQTVQDYCRSIVEVCPRGQRQDLVATWRRTMLHAMAAFDATIK